MAWNNTLGDVRWFGRSPEAFPTLSECVEENVLGGSARYHSGELGSRECRNRGEHLALR